MQRFHPWLDWLAAQQDEMLAATLNLAAINSGSFNVAGVDRVGEQMLRLCRPLQAQVAVHPLPLHRLIDDQGELQSRPLGHAIVLSKHPTAPRQLYLGGHLDTVYPAEHPFQHCIRLSEQRLRGPGLTDMKGGLVVMLYALLALERSPWAGRLGWRVLLNPDEEIGSPASAALLRRLARQVDLGLIFEPAFADGRLAGARKGSGNFTLVVHGRAAHAGRAPEQGRNAVRALSDFIVALDALNACQPGLTVNPAFVAGGGALNVVPDLALVRFNIRVQTPAQIDWCRQQLARLIAQGEAREGIRLELHGDFGRPPKRLDAATLKLLQLARDSAQQLGFELDWADTGGCCDGNNLAAAGVPNLDNLGVRGGAIHSVDEYLEVDSLVERARLSALILLQLADDAALAASISASSGRGDGRCTDETGDTDQR